jgi:hypothetical protein
LKGFCDFILTRGESQSVLIAPFVAVAEVENDQIRTGPGQCIAAMYGAQLWNQNAEKAISCAHGEASMRIDWKFLQLRGTSLTIDVPEYYIDNLPIVMGILRQIVETG